MSDVNEIDNRSCCYKRGVPEYRDGMWLRCDTWYEPDGSVRKVYVYAKDANDNSDIYRGMCIYRCFCCYLNLFHTEEYHKEQTK